MGTTTRLPLTPLNVNAFSLSTNVVGTLTQ
jgi:hypothetical protein